MITTLLAFGTGTSRLTPSDDIRPENVSLMLIGCSNISFCMKCSYPLFSAASASHSSVSTLLSTRAPSMVVISTPPPEITPISPSFMKITFFVYFNMPEASDATKNSESPSPRARGLSFRATTILPGSSVLITASAYDPCTFDSAFRTDDSRSPL